MKLALPQSVRGDVEPGLPKDLDVSWYEGAPEDSPAMLQAEVAWINILDGGGQARAVEAGPNLKWVHTLQAGVNTWPLARIRKRGLLFTNGAGLAAPAIAEFVVMGMLALIKNLTSLIGLQEERRWAPWLFGGEDLVGAKALIVGYGSIGREIGRRLQAFEVEITGVRRHPSGEPGVIGRDDWRPRLGEFDWVILAAASTSETRAMIGEAELVAMKPRAMLTMRAPGFIATSSASTSETRAMIGEAELAAMKPGARIVNIARGFMIDQTALVAALNGGRLGGALLDVTDPEPPAKDDPIWTAPNVLLTSHSSAVSQQFYRRAAALFLDNLGRYRKGEPMRNVVDLELGY